MKILALLFWITLDILIMGVGAVIIASTYDAEYIPVRIAGCGFGCYVVYHSAKSIFKHLNGELTQGKN